MRWNTSSLGIKENTMNLINKYEAPRILAFLLDGRSRVCVGDGGSIQDYGLDPEQDVDW